ncbi:MAG: exosortase/archaeosortase family protein [Deltaproteobacteria bacterium]|nr:exosortase/archaeosortase family protein [Deltaproteobacteria bacterium]
MTERIERSGISLQGIEWLLAIALLAAFVPALIELSHVWSRYEYYSHGYLVPLAALWAATAQRNVLRSLPRERSLLGGVLLALSLLLYLAGRLAASVSLEGVALVASVAGAIYFARGLAWVRRLGFSIAYLIFMVPVPENLITPFIAKLQLFVSSAAIRVVHMLDLPVYREGNVMHLPSGDSLFVAEACSGITSILTLVPLAVFLAYFTQPNLPRRLALVAAVIPLAMLGNLTRVVGTIWVAQRFSSEIATADWLHNLAGILTYVLGCLALLAIGGLMTRYVPAKKVLPSQ